MPLSPSPNPRASGHSSPFTPPRQSDAGRNQAKSVYGGNLSAHFAKSISKATRTSHRDSPKTNKSNIASTRTRKSPKHLELGVSDWTLTGTSATTANTPSKEHIRREIPTRARASKTTVRIPHNAGDRFIPNRSASEGLATSGAQSQKRNSALRVVVPTDRQSSPRRPVLLTLVHVDQMMSLLLLWRTWVWMTMSLLPILAQLLMPWPTNHLWLKLVG
jgi:hypothetical protein